MGIQCKNILITCDALYQILLEHTIWMLIIKNTFVYIVTTWMINKTKILNNKYANKHIKRGQ